MTDLLRILCIGGPPPDLGATPWGPFAIDACATLADAAALLRAAPVDAVLRLSDRDGAAVEDLLAWPGLSGMAQEAALVAVVPEPSAASARKLLQCGAQDVVDADGLTPDMLARVLRLAVERKRLEQAARKSHATDLATGLPNHAQLLEHMTHLLALREREPAPMALIVLRVGGLASTEVALGVEAAQVLRRKVAVRIRSGLRASDVVAAIGPDAYAVLLARIDAPGDAARVAGKLARSVRLPFRLASHERVLAVSVGLAAYPEHGREADGLMRRAVGQAAEVASVGPQGHAQRVERGPAAAANED